MVADGSIMMKVKEIKDTSVMAEMLNTGKLGERKPDRSISVALRQ